MLNNLSILRCFNKWSISVGIRCDYGRFRVAHYRLCYACSRAATCVAWAVVSYAYAASRRRRVAVRSIYSTSWRPYTYARSNVTHIATFKSNSGYSRKESSLKTSFSPSLNAQYPLLKTSHRLLQLAIPRELSYKCPTLKEDPWS